MSSGQNQPTELKGIYHRDHITPDNVENRIAELFSPDASMKHMVAMLTSITSQEMIAKNLRDRVHTARGLWVFAFENNLDLKTLLYHAYQYDTIDPTAFFLKGCVCLLPNLSKLSQVFPPLVYGVIVDVEVAKEDPDDDDAEEDIRVDIMLIDYKGNPKNEKVHSFWYTTITPQPSFDNIWMVPDLNLLGDGIDNAYFTAAFGGLGESVFWKKVATDNDGGTKWVHKKNENLTISNEIYGALFQGDDQDYNSGEGSLNSAAEEEEENSGFDAPSLNNTVNNTGNHNSLNNGEENDIEDKENLFPVTEHFRLILHPQVQEAYTETTSSSTAMAASTSPPGTGQEPPPASLEQKQNWQKMLPPLGPKVPWNIIMQAWRRHGEGAQKKNGTYSKQNELLARMIQIGGTDVPCQPSPHFLVPAIIKNKGGSKWITLVPRWVCTICGKLTHGDGIKADSDHTLNLQLGELFRQNSSSLGFTNTCPECNSPYKKERVLIVMKCVWVASLKNAFGNKIMDKIKDIGVTDEGKISEMRDAILEKLIEDGPLRWPEETVRQKYGWNPNQAQSNTMTLSDGKVKAFKPPSMVVKQTNSYDVLEQKIKDAEEEWNKPSGKIKKKSLKVLGKKGSVYTQENIVEAFKRAAPIDPNLSDIDLCIIYFARYQALLNDPGMGKVIYDTFVGQMDSKINELIEDMELSLNANNGDDDNDAKIEVLCQNIPKGSGGHFRNSN